MPTHGPNEPSARLDTSAFAAAFALAPIGVTITRDGITDYCNPAYLKMFGYEGREEEIYGKDLLVMVAPSHRPAIVAQIEARKAGAPSEAAYDSWGLRRDGTTFPFHVAVRRIVLGSGPATLAFFFDLSDRRRMEEDLRRANDQLAALIEACPVPTMMIDTVGHVLVWNPAAVAAFGWTREDALGRVNPLVGAEHRDEYSRNVAAALASGLRGLPARRRRKDGTDVDIEIFAAPVRDAAGLAVGTMAVVLDVTERNRTEEALRRSEEQLRHAQKMEAVGRLAGGVAHDFNNLLTVISGLAELLAGPAGRAEDAAACAAEMRRAIDRASALTRQLLAFSRRQVQTLDEVDIGAVARGMEPMLRTLVGPDITLVLELATGLGLARADAGQIEQVIANLSLNARDAMPAGGALSIRTRNIDLREALAGDRLSVPPGSYVAIAVKDVGVGMDSAVLARIFEPFFTTKERGKGTGLGLSMVFGLVQQSGGHLHVTSRPGHGSTFEVFLPRLAPASSRAPVEGPVREPISPAVVVLVEDDLTIRSLTRGMLERGGMTVLEAVDAAHALALLRAAVGAPLVLLTDVVMPGTSGPELAARALAAHPELPVVFMSGHAELESFPAHVRSAAAAFVAKPFDAQTLLRKIGEAARGKRSLD